MFREFKVNFFERNFFFFTRMRILMFARAQINFFKWYFFFKKKEYDQVWIQIKRGYFTFETTLLQNIFILSYVNMWNAKYVVMKKSLKLWFMINLWINETQQKQILMKIKICFYDFMANWFFNVKFLKCSSLTAQHHV